MNLVFIDNHRPVTDSLIIAESFGKNHKDVLRDIRNLECSEEFSQRNFAPSSYTSEQNKELPKYLITQDGFSFLVMGYTGKEAARFKEMYIGEFNRMRNELSKPQLTLPQNYVEALKALVTSEEEKITLQLKIETDKPLVDFATTCMTSNKSILVREVAKLASKQGVLIGERRMFQKLRDWELFLKNRNEPTQRGMEMGLFEIKKGVYAHPDGAKDYATPKVTVKGQMYIINRLLKEAS